MNRKIKVKDMKDLAHLNNCMSLEVIDGEVKSITIHLCGEEITITKSSDYSSSLNILVNETKVEETTYMVVGKIEGMEIYPIDYGTDKQAALNFIKEKSQMCGDVDLIIDETTVFVDKTKIG